MPDLSIPNFIENDTPADGNEVQTNYAEIQNFINQYLINSDGSVGMEQPLLLNAGNPTADNQASNKAYVDALIPVGVIMQWAALNPPAGPWRLCNGQDMLVSDWPDLHSVLGYLYGGSGPTFKLPDFRTRVPIGRAASDTRFDTMGETGGQFLLDIPEHLHTINHNHGSFPSGNQSVTHTHPIDHNHASATTTSSGAHTHDGDFTSTGGSGSTSRVVTAGSGTQFALTRTDGAHTHAVDLPLFDGESGAASVTHVHTIDMPNYVGNSGQTGVASATHVQPYVVVQYIIRVDP